MMFGTLPPLVAASLLLSAPAAAPPPLPAPGQVPADIIVDPTPTTTMPILHGPVTVAHEDSPTSVPAPRTPVMPSVAPDASSSSLARDIQLATRFRLRGSTKIPEDPVNAQVNTSEVIAHSNGNFTSEGIGSPSETQDVDVGQVQVDSSRWYFPIGGGVR